MRHVLLTLYPRSWRNRYGEEYQALLEDTGLNLWIILDVAKSALKLRLQEHARALVVMVVLVEWMFSLWLCVHLRITDNMLWPPTTFLRTAGLCITYAPLLYIISTYVGNTKLRPQSK